MVHIDEDTIYFTKNKQTNKQRRQQQQQQQQQTATATTAKTLESITSHSAIVSIATACTSHSLHPCTPPTCPRKCRRQTRSKGAFRGKLPTTGLTFVLKLSKASQISTVSREATYIATTDLTLLLIERPYGVPAFRPPWEK